MNRLASPLAAFVGFILPLLIWRAAPHAFDAPWIALQWSNLVVAAALIVALLAILARRRAIEISTGWSAALSCAAPFSVGAAFGLAITLKWASGVSSDVILFGFLPVSDAREYLTGAINYLDLGQLNEWTTRRPFAALHLAGLLALTADGLRLSLTLLAAGCAASALLVAAQIRRRWGLAAAAGAFASLFAFIHLTLGSSMSESLGFALGCAAFALLVEAAESGRRGWAYLGLALLSTGLATRAGALFALPALALWCGWRWHEQGKKFSWLTTLLAFAAAASGFLVNKALIALAGAPDQVAFGNFSFTLYGLAIGGEPWTRFFVDFPEAITLPEGGRAIMAYQAAIDHMRAAPLDLIKGVAARYNDFLINTGWHKYVPNMALRAFVLLLALTGVIHCWRRRREALPSLLLAGLAGILLSVPFLGDGGARVYAATHGFSVSFIALGIVALARRPAAAPKNDAAPYAIPQAAALFAALMLLPVAVAMLHAPRHQLNEARVCAADETPFVGLLLGARAICAAGAANCGDLRAESLQATNIWKTPKVSEIAASAPTTAGLAIAPTATAWLRATNGLPKNGSKLALCLPGKANDSSLFDYRP